MAKRVMDLLWSIMMNPEAPTEVSKSPAMTDALTAYAQRKVAVDREVAGEYIRQCLAQIQADSSVSAAMNLLQKLVHLSVSSQACAVLSKHCLRHSLCSVCTFQRGFVGNYHVSVIVWSRSPPEALIDLADDLQLEISSTCSLPEDTGIPHLCAQIEERDKRVH